MDEDGKEKEGVEVDQGYLVCFDVFICVKFSFLEDIWPSNKRFSFPWLKVEKFVDITICFFFVLKYMPLVLQVFKQPWPGLMRTLYGNHTRYQAAYFERFPGYYCAGDGIFFDSIYFLDQRPHSYRSFFPVFQH